ncbi:uncharacterized protein [Zea mays]|uniref:uncharacterized protein n=1 Tax=Zea mays TaxID=4577 RepID=UPI0004DEC332|nr:uncharacterized protein LOC103650151 [Zea mays]|eukprot:XP_008674017.1 uncharacterized protein LOC103650151 [Zea mays]
MALHFPQSSSQRCSPSPIPLLAELPLPTSHGARPYLLSLRLRLAGAPLCAQLCSRGPLLLHPARLLICVHARAKLPARRGSIPSSHARSASPSTRRALLVLCSTMEVAVPSSSARTPSCSLHALSSCAESFSSLPRHSVSCLLCSPTSATRWCSNSSAIVVLSTSARPWSCLSSLPMFCCRFEYHHCCVLRCVLTECFRLYLSTRACCWLALTLARLLVVTASHSLFVHRTSRVFAFVIELLNPSSLSRDFVVARALTRFVSSPARSRHNLVVVLCVIKKSQESGEDEASSVVFTKCTIKSSNILHDSSSIRQNYLVEEKIFSN